MHPDEAEERLLDQQMHDICEGRREVDGRHGGRPLRGLREGIEREVERLEREGLPIYVDDNGRIIDLQTNKPAK